MIPQVYYETAIPQVYYKAAIPQVYYKAAIPQLDYKAPLPQVYYKAAIPQVYYKAAIPQVYYKATISQVYYKAAIGYRTADLFFCVNSIILLVFLNLQRHLLRDVDGQAFLRVFGNEILFLRSSDLASIFPGLGQSRSLPAGVGDLLTRLSGDHDKSITRAMPILDVRWV